MGLIDFDQKIASRRRTAAADAATAAQNYPLCEICIARSVSPGRGRKARYLKLNKIKILFNFGQVKTGGKGYGRLRLFPELDDDQLAAPDWYIEHCRPGLGRDFIITARGLLTEEIRAGLEMLRGFQFENHPRLPISGNRLELPGSLVQNQLERVLGRC